MRDDAAVDRGLEVDDRAEAAAADAPPGERSLDLMG
jgi:hypothetical protein